MKVVTAGGATIELGTVETMPTVGITDYSRRVTDDFGVTTVVPRGFARTMQVKLAVPFYAADTLQRQLAALRTTPARWIADDRFACMSVEGFFKDFSIDMAVPPLSYCTLTIEGLAKNEALPDDGSDPAPDGRSTMQLLAPIAITDAGLVASSVSETDYAAWSNATSYGKGARVILAATHRIYESAVDGNAGNDPAGTSGKWLDIGPTNRWAMFDQALGSATSAQGSIVVTITAAAIGAIALLDVVGATVRVQTASYDRTTPVSAGAITFLDLPPATARATVTITGAGTVFVGTLLAGNVVGLGITEASPTAGITDYSRKVVDDFGEVTVVPRAWAKKMDGKSLVSTAAIDAVFGRLAAVRATPALWIGHEGVDCLTIYGFVRDFSLQVGETLSNLSLSIEGLSTAGKVEPFTPGGGSVAWPDITDPDGTKPKPNADQTSQNTSKDTAAVGGKPSGQVLGDISSIDARARKLETETIPAINKAVSDAAGRISAAQYAADQAGKRAEGAFTEIADRVAEIDERIDTISQTGGYDDTAVKASIEQVRKTGVGNSDAIASLTDELHTSVTNLDTKYDAAIKTTARTAASDTKAVSERLDSFIAQGGGGSDGVDTLARSEIQRVERAYIEADKGFAESILNVSSRLDITPVSFRLVSRGNSTALAAGQPDAGVYNAAGQLISGSLRGWNVVVWNAQNQVAQAKTFDTLEGLYDGGAAAMANFLNALPGSTTVTIHTADEPATNHSYQPLIEAMARCGAGSAFTSPSWAYHGAYVLVGRTGIGRGNGVEIYRGTNAGDAGAPDAYISHGFSLLKGVPQVSGNGSVIEATAKDLTQAFTQADQALASRQSALEASASAASASVVFNDNFSFWADGQGLPAHWSYWAAEGNFRVERLAPGRGGGRYCVRTLNDVANVNSGFWQVIYTAGRGKWVVEVTIDKPGGSLQGAGVTLHGIWNIDFCSDPDTNGAVGDSADGEVRSWSKMFDLDGRDQINVHAMHGWSGFGRTIMPKSITWHCLRLRPATDGEIKAGKADAALFGAGGVLARIATTEATIADLPKQYAAASRTDLLEAQVNGENGSRLLSRAESKATALVDGLNGAVNGRMDIMVSEYNGIGARVTQQAGTLATIDGKTSAYVKIIADAGNGVGSFSLWSDQFGGAWELAGNGRIRGNLLVDGEITTTKIAPNQITLPLGAQTVTVKQIAWSNADPQYGVELAIPLTTGAPVRLDFRYSTAGGGQGQQPPLTVQIQRVNGDGSTVNFSDASYIGGIILDYPPAGQRVTYRFYFKHQYAGSGSGVSNIIYQQLFALELKR